MKKIKSYIQDNPHMMLATLLVITGICFLATKISTISGALFGAGASLLGIGVTEWNNRRSNDEEKKQREATARKCLASELNRTIERILYIHERAISNFSSASVDHKFKPKELREDFLPYMPVLYPYSPQFLDLPGKDAMVLTIFYDSLYDLNNFVNNYWMREGQLQTNIFNMVLTLSNKSLEFAKYCIQEFELEKLYPPQLKSRGTLFSRIERSIAIEKQVRE